MNDISDLFGKDPNRPEHPDVWALMEFFLGFDAATETDTNGATNEEAVSKVSAEVLKTADEDSVVYMAVQRGAHCAEDFENVLNTAGIMPAYMIHSVAMFGQGFIAGAEMARRKMAKESAQ